MIYPAYRGSCLCGAVSVTIRPASRSVGTCHCNMCRKWAGGPQMMVECAGAGFEGEDYLGVYESSEWAERGFCKRCGSHHYYRLKKHGNYFVPVGLFDVQDWEFDQQIFIDEKPPFYEFANETNNMTGAEVFAKYAPPSD